jgi:hypothetical protein
MAQATYTPISFWVEMTHSEFTAWIREVNAAAAEDKRRAKEGR